MISCIDLTGACPTAVCLSEDKKYRSMVLGCNDKHTIVASREAS
jgi:hypothetical protein